MWITKFRVFDERNELSMILRKNKVKLYYYPVNHYIKKGRYYFILIGLLDGNEVNKRDYIRDLKRLKNAKKGRRMELLEINEDFITLITSHTMNNEIKLFVRVAYDPSIIHFQPVIWHKDGWEEWVIASANRKNIEKLIQIWEKNYKFELIQLSEKKIKNFGFLTILPKLTTKQKKAINLAIEHGYYEYPRKIGLEKLAKLMRISLSTYQAHLRKAERKLLPFVFSQSK